MDVVETYFEVVAEADSDNIYKGVVEVTIGLNVRASMDVNSSVVTRLEQGKEITVTKIIEEREVKTKKLVNTWITCSEVDGYMLKNSKWYGLMINITHTNAEGKEIKIDAFEDIENPQSYPSWTSQNENEEIKATKYTSEDLDDATGIVDVTEGMWIRRAPSLSATITGYLEHNKKINISAYVYVDNMTWGRVEGGYVLLTDKGGRQYVSVSMSDHDISGVGYGELKETKKLIEKEQSRVTYDIHGLSNATAIVNVDNLNIRETYSKNSKVVKTVPKGTKLEILSIRTNNNTGERWAHTKYGYCLITEDWYVGNYLDISLDGNTTTQVKATTKDEYEYNFTGPATMTSYEEAAQSQKLFGVSDSTDVDDSGMLKNGRGIFGMPYQFMESVDMRLSSSSDFGAMYAERLLTSIPLLIIQPGKANILKDYDWNDRKDALSSMLRGDSEIYSAIFNSENKASKFYSFEYDYASYYSYVNPLCQKAAIYLGLQDQKFDGIPLASYTWEKYANESFKQFFSAKESVAFYLESETQISESFSNSTGENQWASQFNNVSDDVRNMQFILNGIGKVDVLNADNQSTFESIFSGVLSALGGNFIASEQGVAKLSSLGASVVTGAKIMFPKQWSDSDFSTSYSVNIKLRSPDADNLSIYLNIIVPLMHLIALAAPKMDGNNPNAYREPFLIRAFYKGLFNVDMGIIKDLSITKGDKAKWNVNGLPTEVDVSLSIEELYQKMSISSDKDTASLLQNTLMLDYIANTCGVNINEPDLERSIKLYYYTLKNRVKDIITFDGLLGLEQKVSNFLNGLFN